MEAKQVFAWILLAEMEMAPSSWGRPLRTGDVRAIAAGFDPDMIGAIAVWHRPNLQPSRGRYVVIDGQHRCAALRLIGYDDQRVPCLLYEGLTMETAAELSLGLQERRNLHALDKHRAALAAHVRRAVEIDKMLHYCRLELTYHMKPTDVGRLTAIATLNDVWDRMGAGTERVLTVCARAWGGTGAGFAASVLKLVMTVLAAHDGAVDDVHLAETLSVRSPAQWIAKDSVPRRPLTSIAQDVIIEYNKKVRGGNRLTELTPSQYEQSTRKVTKSPTVRGRIDVERVTSGSGVRRMRRRVAEKVQQAAMITEE
jgi:hypothetical protein